jgi:hypothetical protein
MGEVYRARDPRLSREVAVKVLPASFSQDADRLRRFEQEAKAAGVLNHPNITAVYDIGQHDGAPYVVQELLEGETLRSVLAGGKLSPRRAIDYALQIAHGLAAAHEKGIVHRDLKPENLFVTSDGRVKILDFGLAKLTQAESGVASATDLPTETKGTEPGVVLGTLGYMSPEQVRGRLADARSDIFSFGAILYEMLSGRRAFTGDSAADTMSAILREDPPDLSVTNQNISPGLERIVRHCLEKNPEQRFHSAHDVAFALETITGVSTPSAIGAIEARRRRIPWRAILAALAVSAIVAAAFLVGGRWRSPKPPTFRQLTFRRGLVSSARFAPDGQTVIYGASWEGDPFALYQSRVGIPESQTLGLLGVDTISGISSSGEMAVLLQKPGGPTVARVPITGGAPREVSENVDDADISKDGQFLAVVRYAGGTARLEYPIGKTLYQTSGYVSFPKISPDGERIAFFDHPLIADDRGSVAVVGRDGRKATLTPEWASAVGLAWAPSGKEIWFTAAEHGANLAVRAVTPSRKMRLVLTGPGRLILHDIARDGRLLLEKRTVRRVVMCLAPGAKEERDLAWLDYSSLYALSRDGSLLLLGETGEGGGENYGIYVRKTDGSPAVRLGEGFARGFLPDEKSVLAIVPGGKQRLVVVPLGAGEPRTLPDYDLRVRGAFWFPDGKRLLIGGARPGEPLRLFIQEIAGGKARPVGPAGITAPTQLSPDGRLFFAVGPDHKAFFYSTDGGDPRAIPAYEPGQWPAGWSSDSRFLYLHDSHFPAKVWRIEASSGRRELYREIRPSDLTGARALSAVVVSGDGTSYAYAYSRSLSELYVVEGTR